MFHYEAEIQPTIFVIVCKWNVLSIIVVSMGIHGGKQLKPA